MIKYGVINYIFGAPGAGKTTVLAQIYKHYSKKKCFKNKIYSNFPLKGAIEIKDEDIGYYNFYNSIILLDEAGIVYNNRDAFSKRGLMNDPERLDYWKKIRHYLEHDVETRDGKKILGPKGKCFIASQTWDDVDKKLRDLCTNYYLIKKSLIRAFTTIKPIYKHVDIDETTHQPADFFKMDLFFNWRHCWRKRYYKYFESCSVKELPDYPVPGGVALAAAQHELDPEQKEVKAC